MANTNGRISRGIICRQMIPNDSPKGMVTCSPIKEKITGDRTATLKLLIRLKVASEATFPPSIPVMTAADVAVGASTQIKTP